MKLNAKRYPALRDKNEADSAKKQKKKKWKLNYELGGSPGLVVMGGDSCSKGRGFKSWHRRLDGDFSHIFIVKIVTIFV